MPITPEQQKIMQEKAALKREEKKLAELNKPKEEYVTKQEFKNLSDNVSEMISILKNKTDPVPPPTAKQEETINTREVNEAKPNQTPVSPVWEDEAVKILGNYLDHCEVFYPREGGTHFTVVIKKELSNAPKDYLDRMRQDRRTRDVSRDGLDGVIKWCTLIKQNLSKNK